VITNDLLGWGSADTEARFQHNRIENNAIGVEVLQEEGLSSSATLHLNWLKGNGVGVASTTGAAVDARLNWWGCRQGPESSRCDSVEGDVDYTPWLGQHLSGASPSSPRQDPSLRARR
jgi:hypothetical protein